MLVQELCDKLMYLPLTNLERMVVVEKAFLSLPIPSFSKEEVINIIAGASLKIVEALAIERGQPRYFEELTKENIIIACKALAEYAYNLWEKRGDSEEWITIVAHTCDGIRFLLEGKTYLKML